MCDVLSLKTPTAPITSNRNPMSKPHKNNLENATLTSGQKMPLLSTKH